MSPVSLLTACGGSSDTASTSDKTPEASDSGSAAKGDGTLKLCTLLPQTGSLAFLGPPEIAGVKLAVQDINVGWRRETASRSSRSTRGTGRHLEHGQRPPSRSTVSSSQQRRRHLGAASSSVSLSVIDKITGDGVVQISPANTSDLSSPTYADKGLYFRIAPAEYVLQGRVLGDLIASRTATAPWASWLFRTPTAPASRTT